MFSSRRQSAIPGFRLQNYGFKNNPTVTIITVRILKKHKKSVGERISFSAGLSYHISYLPHPACESRLGAYDNFLFHFFSICSWVSRNTS